jgi:phage/plasmid-associated DNA primase
MIEIAELKMIERKMIEPGGDGLPYSSEHMSLNSINENINERNDITINKEMTPIFDNSKLNHDKIKAKQYKINVLREWSFKEHVDKYKLNVIVDNIDILADKIGLGWDRKTNQRIDWNGTRTSIENFHKNKKKNVSVSYKPCKKSPLGRHFSKETSGQGICRPVRHTVFGPNYIDIDMSNCHPFIFLSLCKTYNFDCSHILDYVENRDKRLRTLMEWSEWDRDKCKQTVLSLLNGGDNVEIFHSYGVTIPESCKWIDDFKTQVIAIHGNFFDHPAFANHKTALIKQEGKNVFNFNGKLVNKVLCEFENILIQHAMDFCSKNGFEIGANCFDGLLLKKCLSLGFSIDDDRDCWYIFPGDEKILDDFIKKMEDYVVEEVGMPVKFVVKEMNEGIDLTRLLTNDEKKKLVKEQKLVEKIDAANLKAQEKFEKKERELLSLEIKSSMDEKLSDVKLALIFIERTEKIIYKDCSRNLIFLYNEETCLYEVMNDIKQIKVFIPHVLGSYLLELETNDIEEEFVEKRRLEIMMDKQQQALYNQIIIRIPDKSIDVLSKFDRIPNLFPFGDKVVDFSVDWKSTEFTRKRTRDDFFTKTTNNEFMENPDEEYVMDYYRVLLDANNDEYVNNFITLRSHGLTNDNSFKKIQYWVGASGDNGKTTCAQVETNILGSFVCSNAKKAFTNSNSCLDTEKGNLIGTRSCFINEGDNNLVYKNDFLKELTGNDGMFELRLRSSDLQTKCYLETKPTFVQNPDPDLPQDDNAFLNRVVIVRFNHTYEKNPKKVTEIFSKKNDFFSIFCRKASELCRCNYKFTLCEEMKASTKEIKDQGNTIKQFMESEIVLTDDVTHKIKGNELYRLFEDFYRDSRFEGKCPSNKIFGIALKKDFDFKVTEPIHLSKKIENPTSIYRYIRVKTIKEKNPEQEVEQEVEKRVSLFNTGKPPM